MREIRFARGVVEQLWQHATVRIGNPSRRVAILFFDLLCPFCKKEVAEIDPLLGAAERGLIGFALYDLVVHDEAKPHHLNIRCLPEERRLEAIRSFYSGVVYTMLGCNAQLPPLEPLARLGIFATPTTLVYNMEKDVGRIFAGYTPVDKVIEALLKI